MQVSRFCLPLLSGFLVWLPTLIGPGGAWARPQPPPARTKTASTQGITYVRDVAPLLQRACVGCHREGGVGPFPLQTYGVARKRATLIADVTRRTYMPPWLPAPQMPPFAGQRTLSPADRMLFVRWAQAGAPEGGKSAQGKGRPARVSLAGKSGPAVRPLLASAPPAWRLGMPDRIVRLPHPFRLAAEGSEVCPTFVMPLSLDADRWLRAVDVRSDNPRVLRAVTLFADPSGQARQRFVQSGESGYFAFGAGLDVERRLGEWTPGSGPLTLPPDVAQPLKSGSDLVAMLRCQTSGQVETEQIEIGLYFASHPPRRTPLLLALGAVPMFLRADQTAQVTDEWTLPVAVEALRVTPHADALCRTLTLIASLPDGGARPLLHIPTWDVHWSEPYTYTTPVTLPAGTRIRLSAFFDNTAANPNNAGHPLMVSQPGAEFMDASTGVQVQFLAANPDDEEILRRALLARNTPPKVEKRGGKGHG